MESYQQKLFQIGSIFTPGSPVNEKDLFAGRLEQIGKVMSAASQRGYHAALYGERGVGKTSLANIIPGMLPQGWLVPRVNCDGTDDYVSLWRKALADITLTNEVQSPGFSAEKRVEVTRYIDTLPAQLTPDTIRRALQTISANLQIMVAFDEFDRVTDESAKIYMADTIKALSDFAVPATVLLIGVADSVDALVAGHQSIERALVQIPMPRMSAVEIRLILETGFNRLGMNIGVVATEEVVSLSQGIPYITHLLALESGKIAILRGSNDVTTDDVDKGIQASLEKWQQTTTKSYYDAVQSSQPGNIYKQVLLACALAETDELGYFSAASVRTPLRTLTGRDYDIPNFAQHLNKFAEGDRGEILARTGEKRRIRFRFTSPLLRPYIVMRGFKDGLLTRAQMKKMSAAAA